MNLKKLGCALGAKLENNLDKAVYSLESFTNFSEWAALIVNRFSRLLGFGICSLVFSSPTFAMFGASQSRVSQEGPRNYELVRVEEGPTGRTLTSVPRGTLTFVRENVPLLPTPISNTNIERIRPTLSRRFEKKQLAEAARKKFQENQNKQRALIARQRKQQEARIEAENQARQAAEAKALRAKRYEPCIVTHFQPFMNSDTGEVIDSFHIPLEILKIPNVGYVEPRNLRTTGSRSALTPSPVIALRHELSLSFDSMKVERPKKSAEPTSPN